MKKLSMTICLALALMMALMCAACGGKTPAKEIDIKQTAASIAANCKFDDAYMEEVPAPEFTLNGIYDVDPALIEGEEGAKLASVYVASSGPEAIICVKAVDVDAANTIMDRIQNRILADAEAYKSYGPEQVPKLETAVKVVSGVYVIVAVTADNTAAASYINGLVK